MDNPQQFLVTVSGKTPLNFRSDGYLILTMFNGTKLEIAPTSGATVVTLAPASGLGKKLTITTTEQASGGVQPSINFGNRTLTFREDGLYYNGVKIGG